MFKPWIITWVIAGLMVMPNAALRAETTSALSLAYPTGRISLSSHQDALTIKGFSYNPDIPFEIEFLTDQTIDKRNDQEVILKLVKYFMAGLTIPEGDLWVNLSPYQQETIAVDQLVMTALGRDLLAQDYLLKQLAASLLHPDTSTGKVFYQRLYQQKGQDRFDTQIINKVWIVPNAADVYIHDNEVYITHATLRVMLEEDYLATIKNTTINNAQKMKSNVAVNDLLREIMIPVLEEEINQGINFAPLRQIYHAMILAKVFKLLSQGNEIAVNYVNQQKVAGIDEVNLEVKRMIYQQYLRAYKQGVINEVREEQEGIVKYFSGGLIVMPEKIGQSLIAPKGKMNAVTVKLETISNDQAMSTKRILNPLNNRLVIGFNEQPLSLLIRGNVYQINATMDGIELKFIKSSKGKSSVSLDSERMQTRELLEGESIALGDRSYLKIDEEDVLYIENKIMAIADQEEAVIVFESKGNQHVIIEQEGLKEINEARNKDMNPKRRGVTALTTELFNQVHRNHSADNVFNIVDKISRKYQGKALRKKQFSPVMLKGNDNVVIADRLMSTEEDLIRLNDFTAQERQYILAAYTNQEVIFIDLPIEETGIDNQPPVTQRVAYFFNSQHLMINQRMDPDSPSPIWVNANQRDAYLKIGPELIRLRFHQGVLQLMRQGTGQRKISLLNIRGNVLFELIDRQWISLAVHQGGEYEVFIDDRDRRKIYKPLWFSINGENGVVVFQAETQWLDLNYAIAVFSFEAKTINTKDLKKDEIPPKIKNPVGDQNRFFLEPGDNAEFNIDNPVIISQGNIKISLFLEEDQMVIRNQYGQPIAMVVDDIEKRIDPQNGTAKIDIEKLGEGIRLIIGEGEFIIKQIMSGRINIANETSVEAVIFDYGSGDLDYAMTNADPKYGGIDLNNIDIHQSLDGEVTRPRDALLSVKRANLKGLVPVIINFYQRDNFN